MNFPIPLPLFFILVKKFVNVYYKIEQLRRQYDVLVKTMTNQKTGQKFIFENPMFVSVLKGALKALKWVSISTFDYKLSLLSSGLERWVDKKEKEYKEEQQKLKEEKEQMGLY